MHFSYALLALVGAVAINAQIPSIPGCSQNCFVTALASDGCSSITDFKCACSKPSLLSSIEPCVAKACSSADQAKVNAVIKQICQSAGVPVSIPPASGAPVSSSSASSIPAPSASSSSVAPSSSAASSTPVSSSASAPTSTNIVAPTITSLTSAPPTAAAPSPSKSPNASSTSQAFTGGANHVQGQLGGFAALLFAAYYL